MDPTYLLIAAALIILPIVLTKLLSGKLGDTAKVMGAYTPAEKSAAAPGAPGMLTSQVKELLAQGRKIEAIKLARETSGISLEAAKDSVEAIEKHGRPTLGEMGMMSTVRLAQELGKEVHELVAKGQKIEAIKRIREQTGLGLKEAKDLVDRIG